ncbi:unnamed protein product, partial [Rotaria magnacalcarata]
EKSDRTSSTLNLTQQQNSSSNCDLSLSADELSISSHINSDTEAKPSLIPIPVAMYTPATSA